MRILGADQPGVEQGRTETTQANTSHGILKVNVLKKEREGNFLQITYFHNVEEHRNHYTVDRSACVIQLVFFLNNQSFNKPDGWISGQFCDWNFTDCTAFIT
jgi:hypothetical protein